MPFMPDQVHVFGKDPKTGQERLFGFNPYKRFERRTDPGRGDTESYNAQGGRWWSNGGEEIDASQVPEWVWKECKCMAAEDRASYRILLPEEIAAGRRVPTFDEQEEYPSKKDVMKALYELDPADDAQWTNDGLPSLAAVRKALGVAVSRAKLDQIAPTFVRPTRS